MSSTTVVSAGKGCVALGYAVCGVAATACVMCRTDSLSVGIVVMAGRHAVNAVNKGTGWCTPISVKSNSVASASADKVLKSIGSACAGKRYLGRVQIHPSHTEM